jgi:chromosome segregation protein
LFLTKLDLHGFKSFVDATEVSFGNGITAIVGPNGCGKTNISDAIRWVMGEQSAKQLRGDAMDDVIFNGSARRKPIGMAEVTLTMLNDKGILPTEYSEVEIGRRVYRSGMSEYVLNKKVVRLKDIKDLFFDTGMGSHAYSVIERSMVDNLLGDNTGHRRFLFEEASGITKYKQRKKEALNKLEATQTDLLRVTDLLVEIERELSSLARQVAKARRYERLRGEIQDLDLRLSALKHKDLIVREKELAEEHQAESVRREAAQTELDTREAALASLKVEQIDEERTLTAAQSHLSEREAARASAQHEALVLKERGDGLTRRIRELDDELARASERLAELTGREAELRAQLGTLEDEVGARATEREARETALAAIEGELKEMRVEAAGVKQLALDLFQAESKARAEVERSRERLSNLAERREAAQVALAGLAERLGQIGSTGAALVEERDAHDAALAEARTRETELAAQGRELETQGAKRAEDESALRATVAAAASRRATLEELKRAYEGVDEAVKDALAEGRAHGAVGLVADVIDVPGEWLDAVSAALGTALSAVVFQTQTAAETARERLVGKDRGRAAFVAIDAARGVADALNGAGGARRSAAAGLAGVVALADVVAPRGTSGPIVAALLAGVFALGDDRAAEAAAQEFPEFTWVSRRGTVFQRGLATAGRAQGADRGLLRREHEIQALATELVTLEAQLAEAMRARAAWAAEREAWQTATRTHAEAIERTREQAQGARARLDALERERTQAEAERKARLDETVAVAHDEASVTEQLAALEAALTDTSGRSTAQSGEAQSLEQRLVEHETRREAQAAEAAAARDAWLDTTTRLSVLKEELARCEVTARELSQGRAVREGERVAALDRQAETEGGRKTAESSLEGLVAKEAEARTAADEARKRTQSKREVVQAEETALRGLRHEAAALAELAHTLEVQRLNARSELDRTLERLRVEYEVDLTTYEPGPWDEERHEGAFEAERADRRLTEIRERFRALGPVNLLALEEYERKKERHDFLRTQVTDLQSARGQLLEAIEKINTTASQLFIETFGEVQKHFTDTFATLFVGGSAELRMVGDDPLECEIDILARPRGKSLQSISLLSSGERALTAIALLFAIYLIKPSPFCLLDEVDAPLDEANVDRFVALLRRFSAKTQFIMITHNKKTMEAAGALYGVTMQEPGVSKLVSVRFETPESRGPGGAEAGEGAESGEAGAADDVTASEAFAQPALAGAGSDAGDTA